MRSGGQAAALPESRRVPGAFPSGCRKPADKYANVSRPPLRSFGGQSVQKRGRWKSSKYLRRYEISGRVNKTWSEPVPLVQPYPPALGITSLSRLSSTASTAHRPKAFVLEPRYTVCKTRSISDDNTVFFDEDFGKFVHPGKWPNSRCVALATSTFSLNCQGSSASAECVRTLGTARVVSL